MWQANITRISFIYASCVKDLCFLETKFGRMVLGLVCLLCPMHRSQISRTSTELKSVENKSRTVEDLFSTDFNLRYCRIRWYVTGRTGPSPAPRRRSFTIATTTSSSFLPRTCSGPVPLLAPFLPRRAHVLLLIPVLPQLLAPAPAVHDVAAPSSLAQTLTLNVIPPSSTS